MSKVLCVRMMMHHRYGKLRVYAWRTDTHTYSEIIKIIWYEIKKENCLTKLSTNHSARFRSHQKVMRVSEWVIEWLLQTNMSVQWLNSFPSKWEVKTGEWKREKKTLRRNTLKDRQFSWVNKNICLFFWAKVKKEVKFRRSKKNAEEMNEFISVAENGSWNVDVLSRAQTVASLRFFSISSTVGFFFGETWKFYHTKEPNNKKKHQSKILIHNFRRWFCHFFAILFALFEATKNEKDFVSNWQNKNANKKRKEERNNNKQDILLW